MKKLLKLLSLGLFVTLASCAMETSRVKPDIKPEPPVNNGEEVDTEINIAIPGGFSVMSTRALTAEQESAIDDAYILVFDDDNTLNRALFVGDGQITQTGKEGSISVTLPSGDHKIAVITNASALVAAELDDMTGESYTTVMAALTQTVAGKLHANEGFIPMWGETETMTITKESDIGVTLVRSLARVDIGVGTWDDTSWTGENGTGQTIPFLITEVYVINPQDAFAVVPDATKYAGGESGEVPTVVGDLFGAEDSETTFKYESEGNLQSTIYVPEADILVAEGGEKGDDNHTSRMALVVGGKYGPTPEIAETAETSYYRVDFHNGTKLIDVLRNHLYRFSISGVKGEGAPEVIEAYESNQNLLTATVLDWDEIPFDNISVVGDAFMAITTDEMTWTGLGGLALSTTIHTNVYDFGVYTDASTEPLLTSGAAVAAGADGATAETTHFRYTLTKVADSNEDFTLSVIPRAYNVAASGAAVTEAVNIVDDNNFFAGEIDLAVSQGFTPLDATYVPSTAGEVSIVNSHGTLIWAASNLQDNGQFAPAATDDGALFQWGRNEAIYYEDNLDGFFTGQPYLNPGTWDPAYNNGQKGSTDPCADGWRLPNQQEIRDLINATTDGTNAVVGNSADTSHTSFVYEMGDGKGLTVTPVGGSSSSLFIPNAGFISPSSVVADKRGVRPAMWSGSVSGVSGGGLYASSSWHLRFDGEKPEEANGWVQAISINHAYPVRCVRNVGGSAVATYAVTAAGSGAGGTATAVTPLVAAGQRARVSTTVNAGYTFDGWTSSDITISAADKMNLSLDFTMPAAAVTVTANFTSLVPELEPEPPYIIYWDETSQTMALGSWNNGPGGAVTQANMLFFQFGSTIGFLNQEAAASGTQNFDASDIKFNLTTDTSYMSLNNWTDWFADAGVTYAAATHAVDGFVSSAAYHSASNVQTGRGDPCKLVGLTIAQIKAGTIDNGKWRMPTLAEQQAEGWATYTGYGAYPTVNTINTPAGVRNSSGGFLPAAGDRNTVGTYGVGVQGDFWVSRPNSATNGYRLLFYNGSVNPAHADNARYGFGVRCVKGDSIAMIPVSSGNLIWSKFDVATAGNFTASESIAGTTFSWTAATTGGTGSDGSVCPADWRMPTGKELFNLINLYTGAETQADFTYANTGFATGAYTNTSHSSVGLRIENKNDATQSILLYSLDGAAAGYWSSTEYPTNNAWGLAFRAGYITGYSICNERTYMRRVRCVRTP